MEGAVRDAFRTCCTCSRYHAAELGAYAWCVARGSGNGMGKVHVKVIRTRGPVRVKFKPMMALHGFEFPGEKTHRTPAENKGYVWA